MIPINWIKPNLTHEYAREKGFFEVWPEENKLQCPTEREFTTGAQMLGKTITIPFAEIKTKVDDWKSGDSYSESDTFSWLKTQNQLEMPIAFETRGKLIVFSGRHRIGYTISLKSPLTVLVLPYPEIGEELYSKSIK